MRKRRAGACVSGTAGSSSWTGTRVVSRARSRENPRRSVERRKPMKTLLVVTAHPGDFVWRAGGAIALHAKAGWRAHITCLSFGERGESQGAWRQPGATLEGVKAGRKAEAEKAAGVLGAAIEFFDAGDYPLGLTPALMERM